jgi:hypothetical protein
MSSPHTIRGKYHILDFPLPGVWVDKLLGRIVLDNDFPTTITAPPNDGPDGSWIPQKIVPEIASERVSYNTLSYLLDDFKDTEQSGKLSNYFKERAMKATSATHAIKAIQAERIDMSNIEDKLASLWKDANYRKEAEKILIHNGQIRRLGMVTGIYVSKSLTVQVEDTKETAVGAGFRAPISEALGDPTGTLDASLEAKREHTNAKREEFQINELSVFAVAYTDVTLETVPLETPVKKERFFRLKKTNKKHKVGVDFEYKIYIDTSPGKKLFAGSGSSSGSDDERDEGSMTSAPTRVEAAAVVETDSTANDQEPEVGSIASTNVEESGQMENVPYVFRAPETVFGSA